jgi:hypothetical protein
MKALVERRERVRDDLRAAIAAARDKEQRIAQLQAELARLPHDVNRAVYTRRILEIIKNVKKQQVDIDKVCYSGETGEWWWLLTWEGTDSDRYSPSAQGNQRYQ